MTDLEKLISGCKKYQADSQKKLFNQYFTVMMAICQRYAKNSQDAEEMLNNGFLKIFINIGQYEGKGSFEGWMKKTMSNTCLDFFKSKLYKENELKVEIANVDDQEMVIENLSMAAGNFGKNKVEEKFDQESLLSTLNQLPALTKTIFNLIVFEDYTHKEIADELNIAERTSQWHFSNAKKKLALLLSNTQL